MLYHVVWLQHTGLFLCSKKSDLVANAVCHQMSLTPIQYNIQQFFPVTQQILIPLQPVSHISFDLKACRKSLNHHESTDGLYFKCMEMCPNPKKPAVLFFSRLKPKQEAPSSCCLSH